MRSSSRRAARGEIARGAVLVVVVVVVVGFTGLKRMVLRGVTPSRGDIKTTTTITAKGMACTAARLGRDHKRPRMGGHFEEAGSRTKERNVRDGMVFFFFFSHEHATLERTGVWPAARHKWLFNGYVKREKVVGECRNWPAPTEAGGGFTHTQRTTTATTTTLSLSTKDTLVLADTKHLHRHTDTLMYHFSCNSPLHILPLHSHYGT